jgi:hypothetical protein
MHLLIFMFHREIQAQQVLLVQRVQLALRDPQVIQAQLVIQVCLVKRAHKVHLDKDLIFEVHTLQEQFTMSTL